MTYRISLHISESLKNDFDFLKKYYQENSNAMVKRLIIAEVTRLKENNKEIKNV